MRFNETKPDDPHARSRTTNFEGGEAFDPDSPELELYKVTINNLLEDRYYTDADESLADVLAAFDAVADTDPEFVLKLAAWGQQEAGLRSVTTLLWVLATNHPATQPFARDYATAILVRPDQVTNAVAMHDALFDVPLPQSMRKGINDALHTWDAYQFGKYSTDRREVSLRDVVNRTHPRPRDDTRREIFRRLMRGSLDDYPDVAPLETPTTWETVLTAKGNTVEAWRSVVDSMGLLAKIRNVRSMLGAGLDGEEIFGDESMEHVRATKFFPFRFYQSYDAMKSAGLSDGYVESWLSQAIDETAANVPDELGDTFVAVDVSGSMRHEVSGRSTFRMVDIAAFFGAVLSQQGADVGAFGEDFERVRFHSGTPTVERQGKITGKMNTLGGATNAWKVLAHLRDSGVEYDRIVFLTDMQAWDSSHFVHGVSAWRIDGTDKPETVREWFDDYRRDVNSGACLYMCDLSNYGDLVTPDGYDNVFNVNGWTSKLVDFIVHAERPGDAIRDVKAFDPAG